jgi:ankyrin repeat protein
MSKLSGIRDLDREILGKVDDKELLNACSMDRYTWNIVCDDAFIRRRLQKYPDIENYKRDAESWKHFFFRATYYINSMKEQFSFIYSSGNFLNQYKLLAEFSSGDFSNKNDLLMFSSLEGELELVIWSLKKGVKYNSLNTALNGASENGHLEVVKYLVEAGADIHNSDEFPLRLAIYNGHLEIVKYLIELGADIHIYEDFALRIASRDGYLEIVKYLVEKGADIHAEDNCALNCAKINGHLEVVEYLLKNGAVDF